jgi:hypothetical protein
MQLECSTMPGDSSSRCFLCSLDSSRWGYLLSTPHDSYTLGDLARRHLGTLFTVHSFIRERYEATGKRPSIGESQKMFTHLTSSTGSYGFPMAVYNNPVALTSLSQACATLMNIKEAPSQWTPEITRHVAHTVAQLLELDAQLRSSPTLALDAVAGGFSIENVRPAVPKMHAMKRKRLLSAVAARLSLHPLNSH